MLTPVSDLIWISSLMSACAGALAVTLLAGVLYWTRRPFPFLDGRRGSLMYQRPGNSRVVMTAEQLRKIPMIVYSDISFMNGSADDLLTALQSKELETQRGRKTAGETRRMCCICLESYSCGEKLRVLPCAHRFHASCIDQWLMYRQSLCPVCKADARSKSTRSFQSSNRTLFSGRRGMVLAWLRNRWDSAPWRRAGRESVSASSTTVIASSMESHDFPPIEDTEILHTIDSHSVTGEFSSNVYSEAGDVRLLDHFDAGGASTSLTGRDAAHGEAADVPDVGMLEALNNDSNFSESPLSDGEWDLEAAAVMRTRRN